MAPPHAVRPENIIKTCEDLIKINNADEALTILKNFIGSKRFRFITAAQAESIGSMFVSLCVTKTDSKLAKEGLFSFKKNVQQMNDGIVTIGVVAKKYLQLGEAALLKASENAKNAAEENNEILDDELKSPETILLSIVSSQDSKDRSDRELLTPHLKFMYDSYRSVIEVIRNMKPLEVLYCHAATQGLRFCEKYNRKLEFKKLSELVRNHLQSINYYASTSVSQHQIDLSNPATLESFLQLRFAALGISVRLELYQESFKNVEDIHNLLVLFKRSPKPSIMLSYYENLAKIFNVSSNTLFRSLSWLKFFNLYCKSPNATIENLQTYASIIVISSLSISEITNAYDDDEKFKNNRLASLLNLTEIPTRNSVIQSINNSNFLRFVDPSLKTLFDVMENEHGDFDTLFIKHELSPLLDKIHATSKYKTFFNSLLESVLIKIFKHVANTYETVKWSFLVDLTSFKNSKFQLNADKIENLLINAGRDGLIGKFKIDHDEGVIKFVSEPLNDDLVTSQLMNLSKTLLKSKYNIESTVEYKDISKDFIKLANEELAKEREEILQRAELLERRKQIRMEEEAQKLEEAKRIREEKMALERKMEKERLEAEAKRRQEEKLEREKAEIHEKEKLKIVNEINKVGAVKIDVNEINSLEIADLRKMQLQQLEKDKDDTQERLKVLFKKQDHLERAMRSYELKLLEEDAKKQREEDLKAYEATKSKLVEKAQKEHSSALALHERLSRIAGEYESYRKLKISSKHQQIIDAKKAEAKAALEKAKQARIDELKKKKLAELIKQQQEEKLRLEQEEKERKQREEVERLKKELAEQNARDEAARQPAKKSYIPPSKRGAFASVGATRTASYAHPPSTLSPRPSPVPRSASVSENPAQGGKPLTYSERMRLKREGKI